MKITKTPANLSHMKPFQKGLKTLRSILLKMRDEMQGGYTDTKDGKFVGAANYISKSLPHATPKELDDLFALAGIVPDSIHINGDCGSCVFGSSEGGDLGWSKPCSGCSRPKMTHFVPLASLTKRSLVLTDKQARFLENVLAQHWWATGIVLAPKFSKEWNKQLSECHRLENILKDRDMMVNGMHGRKVTQKGLLALKNHNKKAA